MLKQIHGDSTWRDSLTKLRIFELDEYTRVIYVDNDGMILRNMNHLFTLPDALIAMPRAYWIDQPFYSDQLAVITPASQRLKLMLEVAKERGHKGEKAFDMDVVNDLFAGSCLTLPNTYDVITGEFRLASDRHAKFLGNKYEVWDARAVYKEAYYIHFSDWPLPKPWLRSITDVQTRTGAACKAPCYESEILSEVYTSFLTMNKEVQTLAIEHNANRTRPI